MTLLWDISDVLTANLRIVMENHFEILRHASSRHSMQAIKLTLGRALWRKIIVEWWNLGDPRRAEGADSSCQGDVIGQQSPSICCRFLLFHYFFCSSNAITIFPGKTLLTIQRTWIQPSTFLRRKKEKYIDRIY